MPGLLFSVFSYQLFLNHKQVCHIYIFLFLIVKFLLTSCSFHSSSLKLCSPFARPSSHFSYSLRSECGAVAQWQFGCIGCIYFYILNLKAFPSTSLHNCTYSSQIIQKNLKFSHLCSAYRTRDMADFPYQLHQSTIFIVIKKDCRQSLCQQSVKKHVYLNI